MWDDRWMGLAQHISGWSKDKSTKIGAVIVDGTQRVISLGWNGFPRGVDDDVATRHDRPEKYFWTEHAERNAIYNAAAVGGSLSGCSMYLPWFPCSDCARAIIQSGITRVVCIEPKWDDSQWGDSFTISKEMFKEAGVEVQYYAAR